MIIIRELPSVDIPSDTSLFISFDYNEDVVKLIKTFDLYKYDKKSKIWEVPIDYLHILIDNLCYIDDITIDTYQKQENASKKYFPILDYKSKPFPHQLEAIEYGLNHDKFLLLDDMGLGKTLEIIYIAEELRAQKKIEHCLIICGINSLKSNWKKEIEKHSNLSCRVLGETINSKGNISYGSISDRAEELVKPIDEFFIITNIESFRNKDMQHALNNSENNIDLVVVDEIHKCVNSQSLQGEALLNIKAKYKIGATGTL